jgi:DNA-binding transcriptional regulator GbsR (MarR family)
MHEAVQQFVERMALICERDGMPRIGGRIFGYLLATGGSFSLDELADTLQASKASVSTNARMLEQLGVIRRVSMLGERRDFYRVQDDPWAQMLQVAQGRWHDMVSVFQEGAEHLPDEGGRARAAAAGGFHALLIRECDAVIERWHALQRSGAPNAPAAAAKE